MLHMAAGAVGESQRFREVVKEMRRVGTGTADEGCAVSADSVALNMYVNVGKMSRTILIGGNRRHGSEWSGATATEIVSAINDGVGGAGTTKFKAANHGTSRS